MREIKEELNLDIQITGHFMNSSYRYETGEIELICYFAKITGGELRLNVHAAAEWIERDRLREFDFAGHRLAVLFYSQLVKPDPLSPLTYPTKY